MNRQQRRANERKGCAKDTEFVYYGENNTVLFSGTEQEMIKRYRESKRKQDGLTLQSGCKYDLNLLKTIGLSKELAHVISSQKIHSDEVGFKFFHDYSFDITDDIYYYIDDSDICDIQIGFLEYFSFENKNTDEHKEIIKDLGCNKFRLEGTFNLYKIGIKDVFLYIILTKDSYILCFDHELIFSGSPEETDIFMEESKIKEFKHNNQYYVKTK